MSEVQANAVTAAARHPEPTTDMWARMVLSSATADAPAEAIRSPGLQMVLSLLDEGVLLGGDGRPRGTRAVPSAGAVYPYEFAAIVMEGGHPSAFRIDGDRRHCTRLASGARVATCLTSSGLSLPPDGGAVVITLIRPWLSMRKYGDLRAARCRARGRKPPLRFGRPGAPGVLRSRFPRSPLTELLKASENFREVHSAVVLGPMAARPFEAAWTMHDGTGQAHREAAWKSWLERACWESLGARSSPSRRTGYRGDAQSSGRPSSARSAPSRRSRLGGVGNMAGSAGGQELQQGLCRRSGAGR